MNATKMGAMIQFAGLLVRAKALACVVLTFCVLSGMTQTGSVDVNQASAGEAASSGSQAQLVAFEMRVAGDEVRTRVVIEFEQRPDYSFYLLGSPHRMVIDLPETLFGIDEQSSKPRGLLSDIRSDLMAPGRSRIVFTAVGPVKPESVEVVANETDDGYRLVFDLVAISDREFAALMRKQKWPEKIRSESKSARLPAVDPSTRRQFTVAIDPGHGGIDAGAKGREGLQEKT